MFMNYTVEKLQDTIKTIKREQRFSDEIIQTLHDGVLVYDPQFNLKIINKEAHKLLHITPDMPFDLDDFPLFKNRKCTLSFTFSSWIDKLLNHQQPPVQPHQPQEHHVWFKPDHQKSASHYLFSANVIYDTNHCIEAVLILIYDITIKSLSDSQQRLLQAATNSFDGQFFTNEKGYITQPNLTFTAYTGLLPNELKRMNLIQWIKKQVVLSHPVESLLKTLMDEGKWSGEVEIRPDKETIFFAVLRLSMIVDQEGNVESYVGTIQDITDTKEAQAEIEHLAFYDDLTDLTNRRLLMELLSNSILHNIRNNTFNPLLYIDLDRFKSVNDMFGHNVGNQLLKRVAALLKENLRQEDVVARIGSDEFVILTNLNTSSEQQAFNYATTLGNKLIQLISREQDIEGIKFHTNASIGACIFPTNALDTPDNILSFADLAMYQAKRLGGHRLAFYESTMTEEMKARHQLEEGLNQSTIDDEFELFYQPQMTSTGEICAVEALVRWRHPVLGLVMPNKFIPIAEDGRQILRIGTWIITQAFKQIKQWHKAHGLNSIAINVSPIQFHEPNFVELVLRLQKETGVLPSTVTFELTEGILIENIEEALDKIHLLSKEGFHFSIDDFGTGYSSLSYFQKLPIQELKIDRSFVDRIPDNQEEVAIINTIIQLATSKSLRIVAEGVEHENQIAFFKTCNTPIIIQGYYYSPPLAKDLFEQKYLVEKQA